MEIWKEIKGFEGKYDVSNLGRVKSFQKETRRGQRILKPRNTPDGYPSCSLCKNGTVKRATVHRLVAEAFIPNPENKPEVNHINGIKTDNRIENLEWCTHQENIQHAFDSGLKISPKGEGHYKSKFNNEQIAFIRHLKELDPLLNIALLSRIMGMNYWTVSQVWRKIHYKNDKFDKKPRINQRKKY